MSKAYKCDICNSFYDEKDKELKKKKPPLTLFDNVNGGRYWVMNY